jgi:uncharacterized damage-inducible protein DinB
MMDKEIQFLIAQLKDSYGGDPWFGRNAKALLNEVSEQDALQKPAGEHSILELVWHMITWREFTISRLQHSPGKDMQYFEQNDWQELDHSNTGLWRQGLDRLQETQNELIGLLDQQDQSLLEKIVDERMYNFRKLLYGLIQHDIYHFGQIAYIKKMISSNSSGKTV